MYKITFVRIGGYNCKTGIPFGYMGRNPDKGFFTKDFNSIEEAVRFSFDITHNCNSYIFMRKLENFSKQERIVFNKKYLSQYRKR